MDTIHVILGLVAVGAGAVAGWLLRERGRMTGQMREAAREAEELRVQAARVNEQIVSDQKAAAAQMEHAGKLHRQEMESVRAAGTADLRRLAELHEQQTRAAGDLHAARLSALEQAKGEIEKRLREFDEKMQKAFGATAAEVLQKNSAQFLTMAGQRFDASKSAVDELVKPIAETLKRTDAKLAVIEAAGTDLRTETGRLVKALREPHVRGRYGEIQLKRVAELAGMSAYCDFCEQEQTRDGEGNPLRPDMIVRMPSERVIVVDAKTNIAAYMDAMNAKSQEEAEVCLTRFSRHVAEQATALARKKYWTQYDGSPEFVVMFIPGDQFVDAALSRQADLLERAAEQGVILASPATLIGLLRAVAVGYQEQKLAKAAGELRELGKELHERAATAFGKIAEVGGALDRAVDKYNEFVRSYESRLEPTLRKFEEAGVKSGKELAEVSEVVVRARGVADAPTLLPEA